MGQIGETNPTVLVVDDDSALAEMLELVLRQEGFNTAWCANGSRALATFKEHLPQIVLLDIMLPGKDGIEVCKQIRGESGVPIIMLTARSETNDVVRGLEAGADDYVSKPFKVKELLARIKARLRNQDDGRKDLLKIGDLEINTQSHIVKRGEEEISLTPLEFDLLVALASKPGQVLSRQKLLEDVWGYRNAADTRLVNVHVQRLRSRLNPTRKILSS